MNPELSQKERKSHARIGFALTTILLLVSLEYKSHTECVSLNSALFGRDQQTTIEIGNYRGSAEAVLSKRRNLNMLNVHLSEKHGYGGMLNAEFSGPLPNVDETCVYQLDETHYVWLVEKDISDKRTHGIFVLRNESGKLYGEVLDGSGNPFTFVLKLKTT